MTNRVSCAPRDLLRKSHQAERERESRKLVLLLDRVKKQIAERGSPMESRTRGVAAKAIDFALPGMDGHALSFD